MQKINEWEGYAAEANLIKILKDKGFKVETSSKDEDIHKHIDLFFYNPDAKDGKKWTLDVKAYNGTNNIWLTMKTYFGNYGPLDAEALDFLVFERENSFCFVIRNELRKLINKKIYEKNDMTVYLNEPEAYKYFSKGGNCGEQLSIWFPFSDIKKLVVKEYIKDSEYELKAIPK